MRYFYSLLVLCLLLSIRSAQSETPEEYQVISPSEVVTLTEKRQEDVFFKKKPFLSTYWKSTPALRICPDSGVSLARAQRAVSYWERLGYSIGPVIVDSGFDMTCFNGGRIGEITVMLVTSDINMENHLAITRNHYYTDTKEILKAQIYILISAASKERVLEHEIGHALGWMHYNRMYHIMHALYKNSGHGSSGLGISEYRRQVEDIESSIAK